MPQPNLIASIGVSLARAARGARQKLAKGADIGKTARLTELGIRRVHKLKGEMAVARGAPASKLVYRPNRPDGTGATTASIRQAASHYFGIAEEW